MSISLQPYNLSSCLEQEEKNGISLYRDNKNYRAMANLLEHPEFRNFFDENFKSYEHIETILMFINLYKEIEKSSPVDLNGYQKLSILDRIIKNADFRREICSQASKCIKLNKKSNKLITKTD